ncbi:spermine synthase isoform X2 [Tribolium castaneum]|uniref:spermine synthase isoform X2 n=1 Tax=Tribolium castaneum TaxID=7070 RepID=UPI00077DA145|nr:PREDICTED: spermine synthase isoform X2 [Tribolium castaneum]|eukprot:XP_015836536.1 PREDICTED: spermine synthase isoform X2 [Tribolium castaneum]
MSVNTILMDFSVDPSAVKNDSQVSVVSSNIENVLREYLANLKTLTTIRLETDVLRLYSSDGGLSATLRIFNTGLITLNIEYLKGESQEALLSFERTKVLEQKLRIVLNCYRCKLLPPIKRGAYIDVYILSSDDRLLEYDIDELVFEERTPYQKIQIVHSKSLGNMLVLDDLQNISEADLIYTETLMGRGIENYKDKEIVILGGGDGALLYELLKEKPKEVIMLEIDEVVMKACAKHMRSICGDVLDKMSGPNYEIIVGDCVKAIEQYIKEGRKFDYVFGDLTDVPLSEAPTGELWDFINKILSLSFKILKPDGKFMTHVIGSAAGDALKMYETQLMKLQPPVKFTTSHAFVPSFLEDWVFYQVFFDKKQ